MTSLVRVGTEEPLSAKNTGALRDYLVPLQIFALSRIGLFALVYISLVLLPVRELLGSWRSHPENLFLDGWARWDSGWYASIVENGYTNRLVSDLGQDTAFFPLYPLAAGLVNKLIGNVLLSGVIVSNVCLLIALIGMYRLISNRYGKETASRSLVLLAICPFSFFFSAMYTESLFLLSLVFAFLFCERRRHLLAGLCGPAAGATKVLGVLTLFGLLV
jgi:Gpi18-like mannosyltransferase